MHDGLSLYCRSCAEQSDTKYQHTTVPLEIAVLPETGSSKGSLFVAQCYVKKQFGKSPRLKHSLPTTIHIMFIQLSSLKLLIQSFKETSF